MGCPQRQACPLVRLGDIDSAICALFRGATHSLA
jgi:hypothetical protein